MMETGPGTFEKLAQYIGSGEVALTASQRTIADRLLSDPEGCAFLTIGQLASACDVNPSTVQRLATTLGYGGYPDLTMVLRAHMREQLRMVQRFESLEGVASTTESFLSRTVDLETRNLTTTFAAISADGWERTVSALASAPRVHVFGLRLTSTVAHVLAFLLELVREEVFRVDISAGRLPEQLRRVRSGDVFVAVGIYPYVQNVVTAFEFARNADATCLALTDTISSPLVHIAHEAILAQTKAESVLRSTTALVSVAQALATSVAVAVGESAGQQLSMKEELLEKLRVYYGADES